MPRYVVARAVGLALAAATSFTRVALVGRGLAVRRGPMVAVVATSFTPVGRGLVAAMKLMRVVLVPVVMVGLMASRLMPLGGMTDRPGLALAVRRVPMVAVVATSFMPVALRVAQVASLAVALVVVPALVVAVATTNSLT
jgi:hypothetical protein